MTGENYIPYSDPRWRQDLGGYTTVCPICKHYIGQNEITREIKCRAFPKEIPMETEKMAGKHKSEYQCAEGYRYEPKN